MKVEAKTLLDQIESATRGVAVVDLPVRDVHQKLDDDIKVLDFTIAKQVAKDLQTDKVEIIVVDEVDKPMKVKKDEVFKFINNHKQSAVNRTLEPTVEGVKKRHLVEVVDFKIIQDVIQNIESGKWVLV